MKMGERKREIREKIITYQYHMAQGDIWQLLDAYDLCLESAHTSDELAEAAYLRADAAFHMGRYHDTVGALTRCLGIEKSAEYAYLETDAYNMLGMLFFFAGYQDVALNSYLSATESAKQYCYVSGEVSALLNAGLLYQTLGDYRKAMIYYKRAREAASEYQATPEMLLTLLCLIQEAQLLFRMGRCEDARRMKREIDAYYQVAAKGEIVLSKDIYEVRLGMYCGAKQQVEQLVDEIFQSLARDGRYLEQIDTYVEFCQFLLENDRETEGRKFLDLLTEKLEATEFLHLRIQVQEMEVLYQERYGSREQYRRACGCYMELRQEYESSMREFRLENLANIEKLQKLAEQREEMEFRSKCDLATGLLNKGAFEYEAERYLAERNRDVTDVLVLIDIDNFKLVNDSYGHLIGDEVIVKLAELMGEIFKGELCGRFGGDEFVVLMRNVTDMEQMELQVEKFREIFARIGFGANGNIHNTVSIGVSYNNGVNASYKSMFSCADEAMLKAKEYSKNKVAFYEIKRGILKYV